MEVTYPWQSRHLIVHKSSHMELEHLDVLCNDVGCRSSLFITDQLVVGLYNVCQLVSEIVLHENTAQLGQKLPLSPWVKCANTAVLHQPSNIESERLFPEKQSCCTT